MIDREAYLKSLNKYWKIYYDLRVPTWSVPNRSNYFAELNDEGLQSITFYMYTVVKRLISIEIESRIQAYEKNRSNHVPNKTADKAFYRFAQASGIGVDILPVALPIKRLIKIHEVYFK